MTSLSIQLSGDDADLPYPTSMAKMKCATCHRFVDYLGRDTMNFRDWLHGDDASEICQPIGIYRA